MSHEPGYPHLRLDLEAVDRNIRTMGDWAAAHGLVLAPHVKTTMSRPIVERQVAAGAVGLTVATVDQAEVVLGWGHDTVLVANEVVDLPGLRRLAHLAAADPARQLRCLVDSADGVRAADRVLAGAGQVLEVMVDVGTPGGRTGVRTVAEARRVAELVHAAPALRLAGVAGYEGVVPNSRAPETVAAVDEHCRRVREAFLQVADLFETDRPVFSMGGSAFPDRVAELLPGVGEVPGTVCLLRSGCYVTHDHGTYARVSTLSGLVPALSVAAVVLSAPEDGTVVVGAGKRDLPYDADLPLLLRAWTADGRPRESPQGHVQAMYDHHTVMSQARELAVTDVVELGISHPCSAFDRWPHYVVTDADGTVVDVWPTDFSRPSLTDFGIRRTRPPGEH